MIRFKTLAQFHRYRGLPQPAHPLLSVIDLAAVKLPEQPEAENLVCDFYMIGLKRDFHARIKYGQQSFDYDSGLMAFQAPGQVFRIEPVSDKPFRPSGWALLLHPDLLWHTPLAAKIRQYGYFDYAVNEALFLSESEEVTVCQIVANIEAELRTAIDRFSQEIVIAQLEALLAYSERFYQRQFITRKITNHQLLDRLDGLLNQWFEDGNAKTGLPTVAALARELNVSPRYLSAMLRVITGLNTQQHIHERLIRKAKELLSTTELSISEIAYTLGFEHLASFTKLFKAKTHSTPQAFRQSFN